MLKKISVIGAGFVGATLAQRIIEGDIADVILVDIAGNIAAGKALDLSDAAPIVGHERTIKGTTGYNEIAGSDIVVVTAGLARKPGMTREDLIAKNAAIIRDVCSNIKTYAPSAIVIVVTNPLDAMTYLAHKATGFERERVFGMAGVLDGSRFIQLLSEELHVPRALIKTCMLGSHGDTMVPVISQTFVSGKPVKDMISAEALGKIIARTRDRGAEIVSLLGTGSAYYSPSAAVYKMIQAISGDTKDTMVVSACLTGEYGLNDLSIGVPCKIGRKGIERIVELDLLREEKDALLRSAEAIKSSTKLL
ncbi:MAG: malate dehydrogenase [Candidatus Omnitrophota bacterium]|jgi:malate dehydrogenase